MHETLAHHDHIAPLEQRSRRRQAQPIDLFVDRRFLFDVEVGRGNVGLGLVVVVIGDKILDRVLGEERLEFLIELRRERFVVSQHKRRPLRLLDHVGDRERLAAAGDAEQNLILGPIIETANQRFDGLRLVALRCIIRL